MGAASGTLNVHTLLYVHIRTCAYTQVWLASRPGSVLYSRSRLYLTYSSVAVDRDGNWLEHRGDKDFAWHLGLIGTSWCVAFIIVACVSRCGHDQSRLNLVPIKAVNLNSM